MIQFDYTITKKDFVDYYRFMFYEEKGKKMLRVLPILVILAFLLLLYVLINPSKLMIILLVILVSVIISFIGLVPWFLSYFAKLAYDQNQNMQFNHLYKINDELITIETNGNESRYQWKELQKVAISRHNIYYTFNEKNVLIIPKIQGIMDQLMPLMKEKRPDLV